MSSGFYFGICRELIHTLREIRDLHVDQKANYVFTVRFHIAFPIESWDK